MKSAAKDFLARRPTKDQVIAYSKTHWIQLALILIALIVSQSWYRGESLLWGNDSTFPLHLDRIDTFFNLHGSGIGAPDARKLPYLVPWGTVLAAWNHLGLPYSPELLQRVLYFALLSGAGVSMAALVRKMFPMLGGLAVLTAALVYSYNQFALTTPWSALANLNFETCLLPAVVLLWIDVLERRSVKRALFASVVWVLFLSPAYMTTPVFLLDFALLVGLTVMFMLKATTAAKRFATLGVSALMLGTWLLMNLYWVLPLTRYAGQESERVYASGDQASLFLLNSPAFGEAIRFGGFWGLHSTFKNIPYFSWADYYDGFAGVLSFVIPLLVVGGLAWLLVDRYRHTAKVPVRSWWFAGFLLVVALVALLFGSRTFGLLDDIKLSVLDAVGLRDPLRSSYARFIPYVVFAFCPLLALGMQGVVDLCAHLINTTTEWLRSFWILLPVVLLVVLVVIISAPMISGQFLDRSGTLLPSNRITVPQDYGNVSKIIGATSGPFNVASFPQGANSLVPLRWNRGDSGYFGAEPLSLYTSHAYLFSDATAAGSARNLRDIVDSRDVSNATRALNLRYIVVHRDANNEYLADQPGWIGVDVSRLIDKLDHDRAVTKRYDGGSLVLYEFKDWSASDVYAMQLRTHSPNDSLQMRNVPYERTWDGFKVNTSVLRPDEVVVLNRPSDDGWRAVGANRFTSGDGLNDFSVTTKGVVELNHAGQRQMIAFYCVSLFVLTVLLTTSFMFYRHRKRAGSVV